jgi:HNH endonuclease
MPQAAHIFPYSMLNPNPKSGQRKTSDMIPDFWKLLRLFWDKGRVEKWRRSIYPNSQNLISLSPTAHARWTKGLFALKPLKLSRNRKKLTVQFFWQVPGNYDVRGRIDLLTEPTSSEGLEIVTNGYWLTRLADDGSTLRIHSGETFTFTTKDPDKLPLPSVELLEMQWFLHRMVGMSGAAGWPSLDDDDDDTADYDDGWLISSLNAT